MNYLILTLSVLSVLQTNAEIISTSNYPKKIVFGNIVSFINSDNSTLTLNKDSGIIILKKQDGTLLEKLDGPYRIRTLTKVTKDKIFQIFTKTKVNDSKYIKVGSFVFWNKTLFSSTCSNSDQVDRIKTSMGNVEHYLSSLSTDKKDDLSEIIIDPSCNKLKSSELKDTIRHNFLDIKESYLTKCLSSTQVQNQLSKNKSLSDVGEKFTLAANKYADEVGKLKNGTTDFKIACEDIADSKINYDAKYKDGVITIPMSGKKLVEENPCKSRASVITHEFFHHSGVQDEKQQKVIDTLCAEANGEKDKIKNKTCKEYYTDMPKEAMVSQSFTNTQLEEASKTAIPEEQAKLAPVLQQEVGQTNTAKEITVSKNDWNSAAQATDSSNPTVNSINTSMSDHFTLMSGALNRSVGLLENTAHASPGSSSRSIASTRETTVKRTNSKNEYVAEEYYADKYRIKTVSSNDIASTEILQSSGDKSLTDNGIRKTVATKNLTAGKSEAAPSGKASQSLASSAVSSNDGTVGENQSANRTIAQAPTANSKWINLLQKESVISGDEYKALKASYNNEKFKQQLAEQGITIQVTRSSSSISLGADRNKASLKFFDDGQSIRRSEGGK